MTIETENKKAFQNKNTGGTASSWRRRCSAAAAYLASATRHAVFGFTRPAAVIALLALFISAVNLYTTALDHPRLAAVAGCNWLYGRGVPGLGSNAEYFVVPVTVMNDGARGGTVLAADLVVEKNGSPKSFRANFIAPAFDKPDQWLAFTPIAVAGHASAANSIVFTQRTRTERPLFDDAGSFQATLQMQPAVRITDGFIDRLFATSTSKPPQVKPIAPVFDGKPVRFDACP